MMFNQDRDGMRQMYVDVWQKYKNKQPLEPLEIQIIDVIQAHPEYHRLLDNAKQHLDADYDWHSGKTNPFLHMGLHLGLRDQISLDFPPGIADIYQQLLVRHQQQHDVEHLMMSVLAETIAEAQQQQTYLDELKYLTRLQGL